MKAIKVSFLNIVKAQNAIDDNILLSKAYYVLRTIERIISLYILKIRRYKPLKYTALIALLFVIVLNYE